MIKSFRAFRRAAALFVAILALTLQGNTAFAKNEPKSGFISEFLGQLDRWLACGSHREARELLVRSLARHPPQPDLA